MPTVAFKSRVRTTSEYITLTLIIRHRIVVGQPSNTVHDMKLSLPDGVDILLDSQLLITISGKLNGGRIPPEKVKDSRIANHLAEYLRLNADELGINAVSNARISGDTGLLTFSCTGSRPLSASSESHPVHAHLVGFDIDYLWQTNAVARSQASQSQMTAAMNPFSRQLSLPFLTVLNNAVERLVTFQLVRRYPLIFGSWCKQLDTERPFFTSIFSSIVHIMERSPHQDFKDTCKHLLKVCRKRIASSSTVTAAALSDYLGSLEGADVWIDSLRKNDEESFTLSMDGFYRSGLKRPLFKGLSGFCILGDTENDALLDDAPALSGNPGLDIDSQFDMVSSSHADVFRVLIAPNGDCPSDDDDLGYIPEHDFLLQCRQDSSSHGKVVNKAFHDNTPPSCPSPDAQCLFFPESENISDFFDDEEHNDVVDFSRHLSSESSLDTDDWTNGVYYASAESNIDYPAIHNSVPFLAHRDWSPDIEPSQEKSIHSSMGIAFAPNDALAQPHKSPSLCYSTAPSIPRTALDPPSYDSSAESSSPLPLHLRYEPDRSNVGDFTFAMEFDHDMLEETARSEDLLDSDQPFELQFDSDSGSDDHGLIIFDQEPNSVALTLGNASAKTWSIIAPEDTSHSGMYQITGIGQAETNGMDETLE